MKKTRIVIALIISLVTFFSLTSINIIFGYDDSGYIGGEQTGYGLTPKAAYKINSNNSTGTRVNLQVDSVSWSKDFTSSSDGVNRNNV